MSDKGKAIGMGICIFGAVGFLGFGLLGIPMILYWHHVKGTWLCDEIDWWMVRGMPSLIVVFAFTRATELFQ